MINKVLNKSFFIRKNHVLYCGKCGKRQLQDNYNMKKHAQECKFKTDIEPRVFSDGEDYAYSFKISKDGSKLFFYVFVYNLTLRPGFKDRYMGASWEKVFTATFYKGRKEVKEEGLYNVDTWMKLMIDEKKIPSLAADEDVEFFRNFFTDVIAFESYGSFLDIYRNRGYGFEKPISNEQANALFETSGESFGYDGHYILNVYGDLHTLNGKCLLKLTVKAQSEIIFEALVGDKYLYSNRKCNDIVPKLLYCNRMVQNHISSDVIDEFDAKNPNFMLKYYLECGGKNVLIPFLASTYNKCMELLYKAGIPSFAESYKDIKKNNELILYKNNLKEIFGLPIKTLKKVSSTSFARENGIFKRLREVYAYNPRFLSLENYGLSALNFLKYQNVTRDPKFVRDNYYSVPTIDTWTDEELFRTLKYLNKIDQNETQTKWDIYKDYITMSTKLGEFVNGKWPKDLDYAHDVTGEMYYARQNELKAAAFKDFVTSDFYKRFSTSFEDDKVLFEDDRYAILLPKSGYDLVRESAQMNNCVKTYIDKVAEKKTMIFFLRDKKNINKSLCTIEVLPNGNLIQLKAYSNSQANEEIKNFVRKWAKAKGITFHSYDIS